MLALKAFFLAGVFALAFDRVAELIHAGLWLAAIGLLFGGAWAYSTD